MSEPSKAPHLRKLAISIVGSNDGDRSQPWALLAELYKFCPHVVAAAAILSASILPYMEGASDSVLAVAAILAIQLLIRFIGDWRFRNRRSNAEFQPWFRGFVAMSLLSGVAWGTTLAILYSGASPQAQVLVLAVGCGIVQACAARAYMAPASTTMVILIMIGIVNIAALSEGNWLMVPICLAYIAFQASYMTRLVELEQARAAAERHTNTLLVKLADSNEKLRQANEQLMRHAATDGLTGLANRRSFDADLATAITVARQAGAPLSLLLLDVDHFKRFNDTHGHLAGDECLRRVGQMLSNECARTTWSAARYGGEEFAVIMPGATRGTAEGFALHLLAQTRSLDLTGIAPAPEPITISIGVATAFGGPVQDVSNGLLARADQGLYAAKQAGRNCVRTVDPVTVTANL